MQDKLEAMLKIQGDHIAILFSLSTLVLPFFASLILFYPDQIVKINVFTLILYAIAAGLGLLLPSFFCALFGYTYKNRRNKQPLKETWALYTTMILAMINGIYWLVLSVIFFLCLSDHLVIKEYLVWGAVFSLLILPALTLFVNVKLADTVEAS